MILPVSKYVQYLEKNLAFWSIYLINWVFLAKGFEVLKPCHPHDHLAPNSVRFDASEMVLLVHVLQEAAKLQAVKLFFIFQRLYFSFSVTKTSYYQSELQIYCLHGFAPCSIGWLVQSFLFHFLQRKMGAKFEIYALLKQSGKTRGCTLFFSIWKVIPNI